MFCIPKDMSYINSYVYADIPSSKDLYLRMGFRYVNSTGATDVESAYQNEPCLVNSSTSIEMASRANNLLNDLNNNKDE